MAAPTPVSALLHAATIMVSGIFFILRLTRALFLTSTEGKGGNHAGCSRNVQVSWTQAKVNNVIPDTGRNDR